METPVLNKRQKKLSLSAKKQKKEIIKNVVANPYECHWPFVTNGLDELKKVLEQNLPRVRTKKINVPWNILKNTPREDRKVLRNEYMQKHTPLETPVTEPNLVFGVNEVTKCLEINSCSIVLLAEVNPRLLVQHILDLAILYNVPILVVPGMKQILEKQCGLESMAMAIKKSTTKDSNLNEIVNCVSKLSKDYPVSTQHINKKKNLLFQQISPDSVMQETNLKEKNTPKPSHIEKCHLRRTSMNNRAFIPAISKETSISQEFIRFHEEIDEEIIESSNVTNSVPYKPLIVKKLKGNKDRKKEKIEQLKRKRK